MGRTSRGIAAVLGLVLGATMVAPNAAHGRQAPGQPVSAEQAGRTATVTLVTGDVVHLTTYPDGSQAASVRPGPTSGPNDHYQTLQRDGQTFIFPDVALPYLSRGLLDERLFNVSELVAQGYDDARARQLPLILEYATDPADAVATRKLLTQPVPAGARKIRELPSVGAVAVGVTRRESARFWEAVDDDRAAAATGATAATLNYRLRKVHLDGQVHASLDVSVPKIGAPAAWQAGFDGTGVTVAVLDTGTDTNHPDLAGKVVEAKNFSEEPDANDGHGHGTHVASTVAGSGAASDGRYRGVAPGAKLLSGKVLNNRGSGPESQIIAGMEWAAPRAKIVSMSLGADPTDGTDPMSRAVNRLSAEHGALFVIASGNAGASEKVATPGAAEAALTVGASTKTDTMASFSSRGPRLGDSVVKPEIVAPGAAITAAMAGTHRYATASGTSMATPHVAGAAAIAAQQHPGRTGEQLKALLTSTATPLAAGTVYDQGAGRADVARAISQKVTASTGALSMGRFLPPFGNNDPVRRTVTYRNDGDAEVTLDLALSATTPSGTIAGPDLLSLSPTSLTIPPGGSAEATVTVEPDSGELGLYSGRLTATARTGGAALTTAVGFHKDQIHTVTMKAIDRTGKPADVRISMYNLDTGALQIIYTQDGQAKVQMRSTAIALATGVPTPNPTRYQEPDITATIRPEVKVNADTEVVFDAREGKPVNIRTPLPTEPYGFVHSFVRRGNAGTFIGGGGGGRGRMFVVPTEPVTIGAMEYAARADLRVPELTARIAGADVALHPRYLTFDTNAVAKRLDGHRRLQAVYVGAGRPDDYLGRDVRGKVALVRDTAGLSVDDQVAAAATAKAALVVVIASAPGPFQPRVSPGVALPTVGLPQSEGNDLLRRLGQGTVLLELTGVPNSPYRYLAFLPSPTVPDGIDHVMDASTTALQHKKVYAVKPDQVGSIADHVYRPSINPISVAAVYPRRFGFAQDEYYTANDSRYNTSVYASFPSESIVGNGRVFTPGTEVTQTWYKAPLRPGTNAVRPATSREGDKFLFTFDSFIDAEPDHVTGRQGEKTAARIYRDGELIAQGPYAVGFFDVGVAAPATYRVELDVTEGRPGFTVSPEVYSAWTFHSARPTAPGPVPLPVLMARWDLDLDLDNAAPAGRTFPLRLKANTQPAAPPVAVTGATVWVSFDDGGTWELVTMNGTDGGFSGDVKHPELEGTTGYVSLRYEINDAAGGRLEQTVYRAYALK